MRQRRLSREEALQEYLIYQIQVYKYFHMFQITMDIVDGRYKPQSSCGHNFRDTVRDSCTGLFASLMDAQNSALNIFDVWLALFHDKEKKIIETWRKIEPHVELVRRYRNDIVCHANKDLRRYIETLREFSRKKQEIIKAMQEFLDLAAELIRSQPTALPNFRADLDPILRKTSPELGPEQVERLKDYFIQNKPLPDAAHKGDSEEEVT
jgi:hypothetical protein